MNCPSCGHNNVDDAQFCDQCGSDFAPVCPACETENKVGARFCRKCRAKLVSEPDEPSATPKAPPRQPASELPVAFAGGRYEVKRFLGEGGRKRVFLARDTRLDREVAIALIKTDGLDEDGLKRVRREAQAMARLGDHPHIVTIHDIGEENGPDGRSQPYIVSQYMAGGELTDALNKAENRRLSLNEALRISNEVRMALEHAHDRGIIHRDLKPANIWLSEDGAAKLGDFGLAVALDRSRLTLEGTLVGTVAYMPPEQALGRPPDARSDLYSLGCVLYEMLTGRPPFLGDDNVAIISQHINTPPVAPSWHNPEIPKALESLIMRCLAKNPDERPESAAAIPDVLNAIAETATKVAAGRVSQEAAANPLDRLAGGVFVGRETEMDELRAGLEDSLSGRGRLLMLVGEPGIGKTRTSEELATYAALRSAKVLWGKCYEGEGAPAYWPWVQLIRTYIHDRDPRELLSEMGPGAADIAEIVPEVRDRLPGLSAPPPLEPEQARFRLFDSITTFLKNASLRQPHMLVLDDLHWADKPSLLLLQFMARELRGSRLLVLGTYRDIELRRQHPLSQTLAELTREGLTQRILLRGLTEGDVKRFIEVTAGVQPPDTLVAAVYRETEGNPFFVNEIVRLLVTDGRLERPETATSWSVTIPQGVREVVGRRLDHLSDDCNQVLTMGAVIGRDFGLRTLERVSGLSGDEILEVLEEAERARVIAEVPNRAEFYTFTHALIKETLYEELSTARRVRAHRKIGEVLEEQYKDDIEAYLPQLAYHFSEAAQGGDVGKAVGYAMRAAERAVEQVAHEEAAVHYDRALQVLDLSDPVDEKRRCEILVALGEAQYKAGDSELAGQTFLRAAELAKTISESELLARAAIGYGEVWWGIGNVNETLVSLLAEALQALSEKDSVLRSMLLARQAWSLGFSPDRRLIPELSKQAVDMARRLDDAAALAYALSAQWVASEGPQRQGKRLEMATEMVNLAEKAGDKRGETIGRHFRIMTSLSMGDMDSVHRDIERYAQLAEELRQPLWNWQGGQYRVMLLLLEGRLAEAETLAREVFAIGRRAFELNARLMLVVQTFAISSERGQIAGFEVPMRAQVEQYPAIPALRAALVLGLLAAGKLDDARVEFDILAANDFRDLTDVNGPTNMALIAQICGQLGDRNRAEILYPILDKYGDSIVVIGAASETYGSMSRLTGIVAATLERWEDAERHFESALAIHRKIGARRWVARTQHNYAAMLVARDAAGDKERALELLTEALDTAQWMGATGLVNECLALKLGLQGVSSASPGASIDAVASLVYAEKPNLRPQAAPDGTVTIMFSDIEGSTEKTEQLGDTRWMEVLRAHNAIIREQLKSHEGFEVKSEGDGFMLAFQSARKAIQCAIAIQKVMAVHNTPGVGFQPDRGGAGDAETPGATQPVGAQHPPKSEPTADSTGAAPAAGQGNDGPQTPQIKVRMGLHTGEVIKEGDDFFGKHVNLAARVAGKASGGEILASSLLRELTASGGDIAFGDPRTVEFKGLAGEHQVWPITWT